MLTNLQEYCGGGGFPNSGEVTCKRQVVIMTYKKICYPVAPIKGQFGGEGELRDTLLVAVA